ncbi:HEPN domain-containing protein [Infirmifilum sp.]|uniref:HEPN domain-containing protein n=1 Tax=Infirmifilum sp. TaxID=2856575 RepID=UPI003D0CEEF6
MRDEAFRWLSEALWDLDTARLLHRNARYNAAAFYAHQAAEKAAKAMLYSVNEPPWGHSVRILPERYFKAKGEKPPEELLCRLRRPPRPRLPSLPQGFRELLIAHVAPGAGEVHEVAAPPGEPEYHV